MFDLYCRFDELNVATVKYYGKQYTKDEAKKELEDMQKEISILSDDVLGKVRNYLND